MAAKSKRHLKKEIIAGKAELPNELQFLSKVDYFAVAEQRVQGAREWYVEVQASLLRTLLDTKKKLNAARLSNRKSNAENRVLQAEVSSLKNELEVLGRVNKQLLDNMEEDSRSAKFQRSPKNFFQSVDESGIKPIGLPLQGGSAGSVKS